MRQIKVCALMMTLCLLLVSCGSKGTDRRGDEMALDVRTAYLGMNSCTATMEVTADYGERVYEYTLTLAYEKEGETVLTVVLPKELAGVTARISKDSAIMEYDGVSLETGALDGEGLSPLGAVPVLFEAIRSGYIAENGTEKLDETDCLRVLYRNPEEKSGTGTALTAWFHSETKALLRGEIAVEGKTVVQCVFTAFAMA